MSSKEDLLSSSVHAEESTVTHPDRATTVRAPQLQADSTSSPSRAGFGFDIDRIAPRVPSGSGPLLGAAAASASRSDIGKEISRFFSTVSSHDDGSDGGLQEDDEGKAFMWGNAMGQSFFDAFKPSTGGSRLRRKVRQEEVLSSPSSTLMSPEDSGSESERDRSPTDRRGGTRRKSRARMRLYKSTYSLQADEISDHRPFDFIFIVAHGATPTPGVLPRNLKQLIETLEWLKKHWFWELNLKIHVELMDWKSVLAPYQNQGLSAVMPTLDILGGTVAQWATPSKAGPVAQDLPVQVKGWFAKMRTKVADVWEKSVGSPAETQSEEARVTLEREGSVTGGAMLLEPEIENPFVTPRGEPQDGDRAAPRRRSSEISVEDVAAAAGGADTVDYEQLSKRYGMRLYLQNVMADILCFLTPRYGNFMVYQLGRLVNKKVRELREDPTGCFRDSQIVLVGHSLGSPLLYELLTGDICRPTLPEITPESNVSMFPDLKLPPLIDSSRFSKPMIDFPVHALFHWGSPLALFMILQNKKTLCYPDLTGRFPPMTKVYNIYHRQDPIAARLEPLLYPRLAFQIPSPVYLPSSKNNKVAEILAFRRQYESTTGTQSKLRNMTTEMFRRLVSGSPPTVDAPENISSAKFHKCLRTPRFRLPDHAHFKRNRFGRVTLHPEAAKVSGEPGIIQHRSSIGFDISEQASLDEESDGYEEHRNSRRASTQTRIYEKLRGRLGRETVLRAQSTIAHLRGYQEVSFEEPFSSPDKPPSVSVPAIVMSGGETPGVPSGAATPAEGQFVVAKGDASRTQEVLRPPRVEGWKQKILLVSEGDVASRQYVTQLRPRSLATMSTPEGPVVRAPRPFTKRQLAIKLADRIRRCMWLFMEAQLERATARGVNEADIKGRRSKALQAIDDETDDFLSEALRIKLPEHEEKLSSLAGTDDADRFLRSRKQQDLLRTEMSLRKEFRQEENISEDEDDEGKQLPARADFAVTESLQEFLFAPLGFFGSHLNYWKCRDTCFFMLKEITGFRPRLHCEDRDRLVNLADTARSQLFGRLKTLLT